MIKIMSFNIRYGTAEDGENRWDRRKPLVINRIKSFDPDLLGLQECRDDSQAEYIKENLPEYEFLGVQRGGDSVTSGEMAPILFKRSAFQVLQWEPFWLSETPHIPGSKSWGSVFPRTATWIQLGHPTSGRSLIFLNTHFDYERTAIQESARLLREWINEAVGQHTLLMTGDFNTEKDSSAYQQLMTGKPYLMDVLRAVKLDRENEGTFHGYGQVPKPIAIDWILATDHFDVIAADIDRHHEGNLYPSDHFPIRARLEWKNPSNP